MIRFSRLASLLYALLGAAPLAWGNGEWRDPTTGMEFVWVPGGTFDMGCGDWNSTCMANEQPVHAVTLDGFWMGKYEVTQKQWEQVVGFNPSPHKDYPDLPVEMINWNSTQEFLRTLNAQGVDKFRLPTEAEWEYACRSGGKREEFAGGRNVDALGWYIVNSSNETHRVGMKSPNGLGLYDMTGNVAEWLQDGYDDKFYAELAALDRNPVNRTVFGYGRVQRGGSWDSPVEEVRCSRRGVGYANDLYANGFRLVRLGGQAPVAVAAPAPVQEQTIGGERLTPIDINLTVASVMPLYKTPDGKKIVSAPATPSFHGEPHPSS